MIDIKPEDIDKSLDIFQKCFKWLKNRRRKRKYLRELLNALEKDAQGLFDINSDKNFNLSVCVEPETTEPETTVPEKFSVKDLSEFGKDNTSIDFGSNRLIFLVGKAGAGKSIALLKIVKESIRKRKDILPVFIDLKTWKDEDSSTLEKIEKDSEEKIIKYQMFIRKLLSSFANDGSYPYNIIDSKMECKLLFIVDAFNEVHSNTARKKILVYLRDFIFDNNSYYVLIASRSNPEKESLKTFYLWNVEESECREILGGNLYNDLLPRKQRMIRIPFFLQMAINSEGGVDDLSFSRSGAIEKFMRDKRNNRPGLESEDIKHLSKATFEVYQKHKSQSIPVQDFKDKLFLSLKDNKSADRIINLLKVRGIIEERDPDNIIFDHQLRSEYLIAKYLSSQSELWCCDVFDNVTSEAASEDVLAMAMEQLKDHTSKDDFIERVYNWNWELALSCVITKLEDGDDITPIEAAIITLVWEKAFDLVPYTKEKARGKLGLLPEKYRKKYEKINDVIADIPKFDKVPGWYEQWFKFLNIFPKTPNEERKFSEDELRLIVDKNSIIGWSASNVLKRFKKLDPNNYLTLRNFYYAQTVEAVRWRAVHTLGSFPTKENIQLLKETVLNDRYMWVQYGAGRSLIECAYKAETNDVKRDIAEWIKENAEYIMESQVKDIKESKVKQAIGRAILISKADEWRNIMRPVLIRFMALEHNADIWKELLDMMNKS